MAAGCSLPPLTATCRSYHRAGSPAPLRPWGILLHLNSGKLAPSPAPARADGGVVHDDGSKWR